MINLVKIMRLAINSNLIWIQKWFMCVCGRIANENDTAKPI